MIFFMSGEKYASPARSNPLVSWTISESVGSGPLSGEAFCDGAVVALLVRAVSADWTFSTPRGA
jgi:hypothetical protein